MKPLTAGCSQEEVHALLGEAIKALDIARQMQIVSEQVELQEGSLKAHWLRYRAALRLEYGSVEQAALVEADLAEARCVAPHDPSVFFFEAIDRCYQNQRLDDLRGIPVGMRPLIRTQLFGSWRYWSGVGHLHWCRRRWYKAFRAFGKAQTLLDSLPPEGYRRVAGYTVILRARRAQAALRCDRPEAAALEIDLATEFDAAKERKYMYPMPLAMARAELALHQGRCQDARNELQRGLVRLATLPTQKQYPPQEIEQDLLAARIARAEGNDVGFRRFAERALEVSIANRLAWSEATVRAVLNGEPF